MRANVIGLPNCASGSGDTANAVLPLSPSVISPDHIDKSLSEASCGNAVVSSGRQRPKCYIL